MKNSKWCISPVEKVIGIHTFLLTFEGVDLSNIFSGIGFRRYENFNLLFVTNASFTKLWDDPESSNAQNGWSRLQMEVEVRERKNEFGDSEEVCRAMELALLFHGQPIRSTGVGSILVHCKTHLQVPDSRVSQPIPPETRWPYRPADLGSAIGLAPQSPGLLVSLKVQMGVS